MCSFDFPGKAFSENKYLRLKTKRNKYYILLFEKYSRTQSQLKHKLTWTQRYTRTTSKQPIIIESKRKSLTFAFLGEPLASWNHSWKESVNRRTRMARSFLPRRRRKRPAVRKTALNMILASTSWRPSWVKSQRKKKWSWRSSSASRSRFCARFVAWSDSRLNTAKEWSSLPVSGHPTTICRLG